ncbi:enoyl-CoA-hydratase DpgB [Paucibacter sp. APW11]|uniref:Enoyl-CoA-hydratase DpgB n=1 Tax=Roseateles aquae TaxID=3077235 RepID=A0ABU3PI52_9BURK|nr:enoyl-CoA-hydratase DpgB [Paucibacter sp. APW11]MDT9002105.1 enoyl-CoA-hydratase DpgB [Paucibacter sp. APW11]
MSSARLMAEIGRACDEAEDNPGTVLQIQLHGVAPGTPSQCAWGEGAEVQLVSQWERTLRRLERLPAPLIAAFEGDCVGLLFDVLLIADYRIAAPNTRFELPKVHSAVWPGMTLYRLTSQLGIGAARRLVLFGQVLSAEQALSTGLLDELDAEPRSRAEAFCQQTAVPAWRDVAVRRRLMLEVASTPYEEALGAHLAASDRTLRAAAVARQAELSRSLDIQPA